MEVSARAVAPCWEKFMRRYAYPLVLAVAVYFAQATVASAAIRPSFFLEEAGWPATDIVVVAQGEAPDAPVTVLETWHGSLAKGAAIRVKDFPRGPLETAKG